MIRDIKFWLQILIIICLIGIICIIIYWFSLIHWSIAIFIVFVLGLCIADKLTD